MSKAPNPKAWSMVSCSITVCRGGGGPFLAGGGMPLVAGADLFALAIAGGALDCGRQAVGTGGDGAALRGAGASADPTGGLPPWQEISMIVLSIFNPSLGPARIGIGPANNFAIFVSAIALPSCGVKTARTF